MKLLNFAVINLTLSLVVGIGLAPFLNTTLEFSGMVSGALVVCLALSYLFARKSTGKILHFSVIAFLLAISLGVFLYHLHDETNQPHHYSNHSLMDGEELRLVIVERLKPSAYQYKYVVELESAGKRNICGKLLLNIAKDSTAPDLQIGHYILTTASLETLPQPLNPYQFDYGAYLRRQHIHHQLSINQEECLVLEGKTHSLKNLAGSVRDHINNSLERYNFQPGELAVINALLLGQRQDLDASLYDNYVNAGAVHILAVSGLHVGIIWLILTFIFRPLIYIKNGRLLGVLFTVCLLWGFAVIAGLSPSVTRAVTMFSVITLAKLLKRPTNIYNTLATSALILLLFDPYYLFQAGFQMSYLAVLGIVTFRPAIIGYYYPENRIARFFYNILVVSLAAQLGVLPVSLYYFHQFPTLFLLSNLIILPCLGLILGFGIFVILMALLKIPYNSFIEFYGWIIQQMNGWVAWVSAKEAFLLTDISFDKHMLIVSYALIIALLLWVRKPSFLRAAYFLGVLLLLQLTWVLKKNHHSESDFIVLHKSKHSLILEKDQNEFRLFSSLDSLRLSSDQTVRDYKVGSFSEISSIKANESFHKFRNYKILKIDSLGIWNVKTIQPDIIVLSQSPKINLERLIDSIRPQLIMADGSNYTSYVNRWQRTCRTKGITFHSTRNNGFLSLVKFMEKEKP